MVRLRLIFVVMGFILLYSVTATAGMQISGLPLPAQSAISASIGHDDRSYHVTQQEGRYQAVNPAQGVEMKWTDQGISVQKYTECLKFHFLGWGYGENSENANNAMPQAKGNRVEYRREGLTEWYVNGPLGVEQGFTIDEAPGLNASLSPLTLRMTYAGNLSIRMEDNGLTLRNGNGTAVLRYSKLIAYDAAGRTLPSWLDVKENQVVIRVDDRGAQYPIVVDPLLQQAELTAVDGAANDWFGYSVSISEDGNTIVIGARYATVGSNAFQGAAYVFVKSGLTWGQQKLIAAAGKVHDQFGSSVSISGDGTKVVVGAPHAIVGSNALQGVAYMFMKSGGTWLQVIPTMIASDGAANDQFGYSVSISEDGNTVVVGADLSNAFQGAAYVFVKSGLTWSQQKLVASAGATGDYFGSSVSISEDGTKVVVGAPHAIVGSNALQGVAYMFMKSGGTWLQVIPTMIASDGAANDQFGSSVSISEDGTKVVVGAPQATVGSNAHQGAAYVFVKSGLAWSQQKLVASDGAVNDYFGFSASISGDGNTVVVGANGSNLNHGAAYIFVKSGLAWSQQKLVASDGAANDSFGISVSMSGDGSTVVAGASGSNAHQGAAYIYFASTINLTVNKSGTGSGTVTSSPSGINCGSTCKADFNSGTQVTLTATPDQGSVFSGWSGDCSSDGSVTMNSSKTCTATFSPCPSNMGSPNLLSPSNGATGIATSPILDWSDVNGADSYTVQVCGDINCSNIIATANITTSQWTVSPALNAGRTYYWRVRAVNSCGNSSPWGGPWSFAVSSQTYNLSVSKTGSGTVTSSPSGINCGSTCNADYNNNTQVTLTATPDASSTFGGWSGCDSTNGAQCTVTMNAVKSVTATFYNATPPHDNAAPPKISVSPKSVNLGSVKVGTLSVPKIVTIKNAGKSNLEISSINVTGNNASEFSQTNDCRTIPVKGSCSVTVSFTPALPFGKKSASVTILSTDPKKPTVNVKLSGQAPPPKISASPMSVNFSCTAGSNTPAPKIVTIKNTGTSDLVINSIVITGSNADEFSQTNECTTIPIPAKGSCTATLTFVPTTDGKKTAIMAIDSNDPKKPTVNVKLNYSGKGCGSGGGGTSACDYWPHSLGSSWTTNLTGGGFSFVVTSEITEASGNNFTMTEKYLTGPDTLDYITMSDGWYWTTKNESCTFDPPAPDIPVCLTEGPSMSKTVTVTCADPENSGVNTYSTRVIGRESVSVPAGTFTDAFKVEHTITTPKATVTGYVWYVNKVGAVKTYQDNGGGAVVGELLNYTIK